MKLIYILLVHKNPEQVLRLIHRLNTPHVRFVVHISLNAQPAVSNALHKAAQQMSNVYLSRRTQVKWGTFEIIQAFLYCVDVIIQKNFEYDLAYILSGQDYPLQSNAEIQNRLSSLRGKQIMEYFPLPADQRGHSADRYSRYHFWLGNRHVHLPLVNRPGQCLLRLPDWLLRKVFPPRPFPLGMKPYDGSFWSAFTPEALAYLHQFSHSAPGTQFQRFLKFTLHPAEMYLQTVLLNSPLKETVENLNLHYVKFPPHSGHPAFLTVSDLEELMASRCLFARKFDAELDSTILDLIDERLKTNSPAPS